jgi:hypothetical protein
MDYVGRLRFRDGASSAERDAALARRAAWDYPSGVAPIAEYWPMSGDVTVITIFSADDIAAVWQLAAEWDDVFHVDICPAVSAEEGLKIGMDVFSRLTRMQS